MSSERRKITPTERRRFSAEEVERAIALQEQNVPLGEIADLLGRSYGSLSQQLHKARQRGYMFTLQEGAKHAARVVWLFEQGVTETELARIYAVTPGAISNMLLRSGLDPEMKREAERDLPARARINTSHLRRAA